MRKGISQTLAVLGIILGILSLSSLIQRMGDVTIVTLLAEILAYYRAVMEQARIVLFDWWIHLIWPGFILPNWILDLLAIWVIMASGNIGESRLYTGRQPRLYPWRQYVLWVRRTPRILIEDVLFAPITYSKNLFVMVRAYFRTVFRGEFGLINVPTALAAVLLAPVLGTALFFAINAFML